MTAHTPIRPSLDERLRYIDIHFDGVTEARKQLIAERVIPDVPAVMGDEARRTKAEIKRGKLIARRAASLIAAKVVEEGLNPAVVVAESIKAELERAREEHAELAA